MILFDMMPIEALAVIGIGVIIFFLLILAAIGFIVYKLVKRKK